VQDYQAEKVQKKNEEKNKEPALVAGGKQLCDKAAVQMSGEAVNSRICEHHLLQCQCLEVVTVVRKGVNEAGKTRCCLTLWSQKRRKLGWIMMYRWKCIEQRWQCINRNLT
jgi:hypothetical protein